jgi:hypothetical protein
MFLLSLMSDSFNLYNILRVFKNRVLWRTFGHKRDEVMGGWTKLCSEQLYTLNSSPNIIRMIKYER